MRHPLRNQTSLAKTSEKKNKRAKLSTQVNTAQGALYSSIVVLNAQPNDVVSQSASLQTGISKLLETYQAKETAYNAAANSLKDKYDEIIKEATVEATAIRAKADADAKAAREKALQETAAWETEKAKLAHTQEFQPTIKLDVGGTKFSTSMATLRRCPDTMLGAMFSGRHALSLDADGYHFIDRDGTHFRYILNFLRAPEKFSVDLLPTQLKELKDECEYYGLLELMFPFVFVPAAPYVVTMQNGQRVTVTQDNKGIWKGWDVPLHVCRHCFAAFKNGGPQPPRTHFYYWEYIPNFTTKEKDNIVPEQPMPATCAACGQPNK